MQRILITGAAGFIGGHLGTALPDAILLLACPTSDYGNLDWKHIGRVDALIHQGACTDTTILDECAMMRNNHDKSVSLFLQAQLAGCTNFIYASSCAVYGNQPGPFTEDMEPCPLNPYAVSKATFDNFAMDFAERTGARVVGLRYSNVYGPGESHKGKSASMVSQILWMLRQGKVSLFHDGTQVRDWVYVKDVVAANLLALDADVSGIYNIGSGQSRSFNDMVASWSNLTGIPPTVEYTVNPHEGRYQKATVVDISKAEEELGYHPEYQLLDGMQDYFNALRSMS